MSDGQTWVTAGAILGGFTTIAVAFFKAFGKRGIYCRSPCGSRYCICDLNKQGRVEDPEALEGGHTGGEDKSEAHKLHSRTGPVPKNEYTGYGSSRSPSPLSLGSSLSQSSSSSSESSEEEGGAAERGHIGGTTKAPNPGDKYRMVPVSSDGYHSEVSQDATSRGFTPGRRIRQMQRKQRRQLKRVRKNHKEVHRELKDWSMKTKTLATQGP